MNKTLKPSRLAAWLIVLVLRFPMHPASAEDNEALVARPIQFCKQDAALPLDFCVAIQPYRNATSASTDLYVTITRRIRTANTGWLGVGLGPTMNGALMFMLHDDNDGDAQEPQHAVMKTIVRTATGHHPPVELSALDLDGGEQQQQPRPDIRVVRSAYDDDTDSAPDDSILPTTQRTGTANILIYSANLWPKTSIDPFSHSQPWIWAYSATSPSPHPPILDTGYGFFWTDFASALLPHPHPPNIPTPDLSSSHPPSLHLSTTHPPPTYLLGNPNLRTWLFHIHGTLASIPFLLLYPLGAILLRTSDSRAFNFHWTTQAFASVLLCLGGALGFVLSRRVELVHQYVGLGVVGMVVGQLLLGWRGHMAFLSGVKGRRWMGRVHVWLGRGLLVVGWINVLLGLAARRYGWVTLVAAGLAILVEAGVVVKVLVFRSKGGFLGVGLMKGARDERRRGVGAGARLREGGGAAPVGLGLGEEYFELVGNDDQETEGEEEVEDVGYDEDGRLKADVEWEERMRGAGTPGESEGMIGRAGDDSSTAKLKKLDVV